MDKRSNTRKAEQYFQNMSEDEDFYNTQLSKKPKFVDNDEYQYDENQRFDQIKDSAFKSYFNRNDQLDQSLSIDYFIKSFSKEVEYERLSTKYPEIPVRLISFMPDICYEKLDHVRVKFFLHDGSSDKKPLPIKYNIEMGCRKNNETTIHSITLTAQAPLIFDSTTNAPFNLVYYYYLEKQNASAKSLILENNLVERGKLRILDLNSFYTINKRQSSGSLKSSELALFELEKYDDIMLFGDESRYSNSNMTNIIKKSRINFLDNLMPLDLIKTIHINIFESNIVLFKQLNDIYDNLCLKEPSYKEFFENSLSNTFDSILNRFGGRDELKSHENILILFIFFCCYKYQLAKSPTWISYLFGLHKSNNYEYYDSIIPNFFKLDNQLDLFKAYLKDYLNQNMKSYHSPEGINALIILYFLDSKARIILNRSEPRKVNNLFKYNLGKKFINQNQKIENLFDYMNPILKSTLFDLTALILNYFSYNMMDHFDTFVNLAQPFQYRAIFEYLLMKIENIERTIEKNFKKNFENQNIQALLELSVDTLSQKLFYFRNELNLTDLELYDLKYDLQYMIKSLLDVLIKHYSKELVSIMQLVQFYINLAISLSNDFYKSSSIAVLNIKYEINNLNQEFSKDIKSLIHEWLKKECDESLLLNNGLNPRQTSDLRRNEIKLDMLKYVTFKIKEYKNNPSNFQQESLFYQSNMLNENELNSLFNKCNEEDIQNLKIKFSSMNPKELSRVKDYLMHTIEYYGIQNEYQVYLNLLKINTIKNERKESFKFKNEFDNYVSSRFKIRIEDRISNNFSEVIEFRYRFNFANFNDYEKKFLEAIDETIHSKLERDDSNLTSLLKELCRSLRDSKLQSLLTMYINRLLMKKWPDNLNSYKEIEQILKWDWFLPLLELHTNHVSKNYSLPLDDKHFNKYIGSIKSLVTTVENVISGNERLDIIELIEIYSHELEKLMTFLIQNSLINKSETRFDENSLKFLRKLIKIRKKERDEFFKYKSNMKQLVQTCKIFRQIDLRYYEDQLKNFDLLTNPKLNNVCKVTEFDPTDWENKDENQLLVSFQPNIIYFTNIDKFKMKKIEEIIGLNRLYCVLFDYILKESCAKICIKHKIEYLNIEHVLNEATWMTFDRLKNDIALKNQNGTMKLSELDELLKIHFGGFYSRLENELIYINSYFRIEMLEERNKQIKLYSKFKSSFKSALAIEQIRIKLNLRNKFIELSDLLSINSAEYKEWNLNKMDKQLERTIQILDKMNDDKLSCLEAFSQSLNLVEWLKNNANNLNELKFLVDLASSTVASTSEDRTMFAKTLKEAGTAFASLIYDLTPNDDFHTFMKLCDKCFSHLESDRKIADKLLAIKDQVNVLNEIKEKKGNVEMNTLKQAKLLNQFGVYKIGFIKQGNQDIFSKIRNSLSLNDLISIELDLNELNKNAKIKLNPDTTKTFYNFDDLKELQNILMLLAPRQSKSDKSEQLKNEDETETLEYFIEIFSSVINLASIYLKLIENGCLFYENLIVNAYCDFKTTQLNTRPKITLFKKHENGCLNLENSLDKTLSSINYITLMMEDTLDLWSKFISNLRDSFNCLNYFTINQLKFLMLNLSGFIQNPNNDFHLLIDMFYNINANLTITKFKEALNKSYQFNQMDQNNSDLTYNLTKNIKISSENNKFIESYLNSWNEFIKKQNKIDLTDKNNLTLRHLAILFDYLSSKSNLDQIKRRIPGYLNKGQPNLIICSSKQQFDIVLSIYSFDSNSAMPNNDEILYCDSNTTAEEVELFLRIVFKSNGNKIFTLMNIQDLSYENSVKIENFIQSSNNINKSDDYILAIICCEEKQLHSLIATIFSRNRKTPILVSDNVMEEYLFDKLKSTSLNGITSYDHENLSVRCLISYRSGNGKSSYVNELCNQIRNDNKSFNYKIIRIKSSKINMETEIEKLLKFKYNDESYNPEFPTLYHIDIAYEVYKNVDYYLFYLVVCSYLKSKDGLIWRRNKSKDFCLIEITPPLLASSRNKLKSIHSMINHLPKIEFRTPKMYLSSLINEARLSHYKDTLFTKLYNTDQYQRCVYYLKLTNEYLNNNPRSSNVMNYSSRVDQSLEINYDPDKIEHYISEREVLEILLLTTKLSDPNWHELNNYTKFLNSQLKLAETSKFFGKIVGMKTICLKLILIMANDFGMASLNVSDDDSQDQETMGTLTSQKTLNEFEIRKFEINEQRKWENMLHPYIIMNSDGAGVTFIGLYLSREKKQFINPNTEQVLSKIDPNIPEIPSDLFIEGFLKQRLPIFENFNRTNRDKKLNVIANLMSLPGVLGRDPDIDYELTLDNCLKMIAIYLRFSCNIPVIVMGETGCGKTSLVKYFSRLHMGEKIQKLLVHFKIHGGVTAQDVKRRLEEAEELSLYNYNILNSTGRVDNKITCILFLDEANTTEEIGLIKEIMCDNTINGRPIKLDYGLKIIAAVNPYRKHSDEMIKKLESAGLGFYLSASDTKEKLGHIPMRQLVYRVQPLPTSMIPLVWDFGQLGNSIESVYISQMIRKAIIEKKFTIKSKITMNNLENESADQQEEEISLIELADSKKIELLCLLLNESQKFMRSKNDECSFVSMRDIDRCIKVTAWFLSIYNLIFEAMNKKKIENMDDSIYLSVLKENPLERAFMLGLSVCYHSSLYNFERRKEYRKLISDKVAKYIDGLPNGEDSIDWFLIEILKCQNIFMDEINIDKKNIANNSALLENVFMMIICIELRIPLFIVGKPGSSKSLAKSIVSSAMQGRNSKSNLFRCLKETYFVNFQCSPLTTSEMIVKAFREAAEFQEKTDLKKSVAVVNLDEIGLAEGSESMPLKALHPLLEEGTDSDEKAHDFQKVAVIGISNWALDPAKMNRGLFVSRGEPDINELIATSKGIFKYDPSVFDSIQEYIADIARSYLELCQEAREFKREFFGLRDFYSLMKMIYWFCSRDRIFTWSKLEHAVKRNFSGLEIDCLRPFKRHLFHKIDTAIYPTDLGCSPINLIESALKSEYSESINRYLLFLTENNSAIDIIQNYLINMVKIPANNLKVIFGSSFRSDQQYTEVCRNISLIKHSMEIGKTVILLNSYNLYESLYDALNQYYYEFGGQKYVDMGLGTHRVKCQVHEKFRLIVIAEKAAVYDSKKFPIPLINRLEKHFFNSSTMLDAKQLELVDEIDKWIKKFSDSNIVHSNMRNLYRPSLNEIFIGYHQETVATLVLNLTENHSSLIQSDIASDEKMSLDSYSYLDQKTTDQIIQMAKSYLLRCTTPDSIIRVFNLSKTFDETEREFIWNEYFVRQKHFYLKELLQNHVNKVHKPDDSNQFVPNLSNAYTTFQNNNFNTSNNLIQITTHSKSKLINTEIKNLTQSFNQNNEMFIYNFEICQLQSFDTQQQFNNKLVSYLEKSTQSIKMSNEKYILLIQSEYDQKNSSDLISCTRHAIVELFKENFSFNFPYIDNIFVCLIINIPKESVKNFIGFQLSYWSCYHLDEIEEPLDDIPPFETLYNKPLSNLLKEALEYNIANSKKDNKYVNLTLLLKNLAQNACSLIKDTNLSRTIERIDLFTKLCDDKLFIVSLTKRLISLLEEKEDPENRYMTHELVYNWLTKEAASFHLINQYSTLRRACQSYIESKLSPLLAYILSIIDLYSNLDTYYRSLSSPDSKWKCDLWLNIMDNKELCKIEYKDMRSKDAFSNELTQFNCQSDWLIKKFTDQFDQNREFRPSLPFFWLLDNHLNQLYKNYHESLLNEKIVNTPDSYVSTISKFFTNSSIFKIFSRIMLIHGIDFKQILLDLYIKDFVLMNCSLNSLKDLDIIKNILSHQIDKLDDHVKSNLTYSLPMVIYTFELIKHKLDIYLKFSMFEPNINEWSNFKSINYFKSTDSLNIDLDSCIESVLIFKRKFSILSDSNQLHLLIQLVSLTLSNSKQYNLKEKIEYINSLYESLVVLRFFVDNVLVQRQFLTLFNNVLNEFNQIFFNKNVNFKTKETIQKLHDFIVWTNIQFSNDSSLKDNLETFYIDTIEYLCFENEPKKLASNEAIQEILGSITGQKIINTAKTNEFTLSTKSRALLVQIVFRNSNEIVFDHLNSWFHQIQVGSGDLFKSTEEVALLFQNCIHDNYLNQISELDIDEQIKFTLNISKELLNNKKDLFKIMQLRKARGTIFDVYDLRIISKIKFCISILAKMIQSQLVYESIKEKETLIEFNSNMKSLILDSGPSNCKILSYYLIKDMIRKYGSSSIRYATSTDEFCWILPEDLANSNNNITDRYVLVGDKYLECKEAILMSFREKNSNELKEWLSKNPEEYLAYFAIAAYQNITLLYRNVDNLTKQITEIFDPIIDEFYLNQSDLLKPLLDNSFNHNLNVNSKNLANIELSLLLVQIKYSIIFSKSDIIIPLKTLILEPKSMSDKYLPTMPHDAIYEVRQAMTLANNSESTKFYQCRNGHPYAIGNCGRPWVKDVCKECGAEIGGEQHKLIEGNSNIFEKLEDQTPKGYSLMEASQTDDIPKDLRLLNQIGFDLERFLINACMYLACGDHGEKSDQVLEIMSYRPDLKQTTLKDFFWQHIEKNLRQICKSLNLTSDEAIILLHAVFAEISEFKPLNKKDIFKDNLIKKDLRQEWELIFYKEYLSIVFNNPSDTLRESNSIIQFKNSKDSENQSKMYFMAYELLAEDKERSYSLYQNEIFWKYRPIVTFESMKVELLNESNVPKQQFKVLKYFAENVDQLQLISSLCDMIKLVKMLQKLFNKSIYRQIAQNKSISEIINSIQLPKDWSIEQVETLVNSFQNVWSGCKHLLIKDKKLSSVLSELKFNMNTKLVFFLPTLNSSGYLSYTLIHYLCLIQNRVLDYYRQTNKVNQFDMKKKADLFENKELSITFNKNKDLSRIILSNFIYDSKNLRFIFKFSNIEYQIIDRYLRTKPDIDLETIPLFEYSDEINDVSIFIKLNETVKQSMIDFKLQIEISNEFKKINDLSEALNKLKIIINYAITTSADANESIDSFLNKIYTGDLVKQSRSVLTSKIVENCSLTHLRNIWILLITKRSILYTLNNQDSFENLNENFKHEAKLNVNRLRFDDSLLYSLSVVIYQIISFVLSNLSMDDLAFYPNYAINDILQRDSLDGLNIMIPDGYYKLNDRFPNDIYYDSELRMEMRFIYSLWKLICESYQNR